MRAILLALVLSVFVPAVSAAKPQLVIESEHNLEMILSGQKGNKVGLILDNGMELSGILKDVGEHVVRLHQLSGREYFDAIISMDEITAVVLRNN